MTKGEYVSIFRRRREGKTDYRKRRGIVVGKIPFLTVRITGKYVYGQILKPTPTGDITVCATSSKDLSKFGWKGSAKNLPGAYLTGYYLGQKALSKNIKAVIVYAGVSRFVHGSRIATLIDGAKSAGVQIEIDKESLPDESRVKGEHIANYAKKLTEEDKASFNQLFSRILSSGMNPADYPSHFEQVKSSISKEGAKV